MAREERRRQRLDQPRESRPGIALPRYDAEALGRISERVARFLGTWRFIGYMSLFIGLWLLWNLLAPHGLQFDPRRKNFTLLTLLLSLQASYAAPLILLAQNRQADRDRVQYDNDRALSERAVADTEYLTREVAAIRVALGEVATRDYLRSELQRLLDELAPRQPEADEEPAVEAGRSERTTQSG
ncbi:MAG TPA: DUF1003 domain-containing protein [Mycobacteriales bacterium]|nr:DUF1003 domain-containing protein [Mycobacteriales bacterium]